MQEIYRELNKTSGKQLVVNEMLYLLFQVQHLHPQHKSTQVNKVDKSMMEHLNTNEVKQKTFNCFG